MTGRADRMAQIARLTAAAFVAEQARMAALKRTEAALRAGADLLWQAWVDRTRGTILQDLARCLVAQAQARSALARTFGRDRAAQDLHARATAEKAAWRARRIE